MVEIRLAELSDLDEVYALCKKNSFIDPDDSKVNFIETQKALFFFMSE